MEVFDDLVKRIVKSFNAAGLDYMFTGALAATFYGLPRTTTDVDVVVGVFGEDRRNKLLLALRRAGLLVNEKEIDKMFVSGDRIATFRDSRTPYSVDVMFSNGKLEKRAGTIAGLRTFYQTPEDLVLAKLRMIKATVPRERALKDVEDVKAIMKFTKVDVKAVRKGARKNSALSLFESITAEVS